MKLKVLNTILLLCLLGVGLTSTATAKEQTIVMISIDGFRWDYIEKHGATNLLEISKKGVRGQKLIPVYPTKTFPNHISIVTGLLPVNHGIVDNEFCDTARDNMCYSMGNGRDDSTWLNGTPIWNLAKQQGLKTATYFWPESDARFNGMTPDYFYHYSQKADYQGRLDQMIQWLEMPENMRPRFIAGYFSLVDTMGHDYGANSIQTREAVQAIDTLIGQFYSRLQALEQDINLVIVSDHGMSDIDPEKIILLSELPQNENFRIINTGPRLLLYAKNKEANIAEYRTRLQEAAQGRYYILNEQQLAEYHYNKGTRIGNIVVQTDAPAVFTSEAKPGYAATHGYAYSDDMAATLVAVGPAFKQGFSIKEVNVLDIYPVFAKILGLKLTTKIDSDGKTLMPSLVLE